MSMSLLKERAEAIRERIAQAAERVGRSPQNVRLVGVSKTRTVEEMREAAPFLDALGENKVQEAQKKKSLWGEVSTPPWRLIGHLQSNKARKAVELFDTVDSLDSLSLALRLDRIAGELGRHLPVLIEVNTSEEDSKTGCLIKDFPELLDKTASLPNLILEGLMTIGPLTDDEKKVRGAFETLRGLSEKARELVGLPLKELSMGMSHDFEWAVLEGSTMVRIGTALFGPRSYDDKS